MRPSASACILLMASALAATPVWAGKATLKSEEGPPIQIEYAEDLFRMEVDPESYVVVREGRMYVVNTSEGQPMVFDASSMMQGMAQSPAEIAPSDLNQSFISLESTGRKETIAGIDGEVYVLKFKDDQGREQTEELVLSGDRRALAFSEAMFSMAAATTEAVGGGEPASGQDVFSHLTGEDKGVLRYGQEMVVTALSDETIPAARFELPAEPMDLTDMGALMGSMTRGAETADNKPEKPAENKEESGGLLGDLMGAIGAKAERQQERAGDAVDQEVDKQTDETVDEALGRAFKSIFGN